MPVTATTLLTISITSVLKSLPSRKLASLHSRWHMMGKLQRSDRATFCLSPQLNLTSLRNFRRQKLTSRCTHHAPPLTTKCLPPTATSIKWFRILTGSRRGCERLTYSWEVIPAADWMLTLRRTTVGHHRARGFISLPRFNPRKIIGRQRAVLRRKRHLFSLQCLHRVISNLVLICQDRLGYRSQSSVKTAKLHPWSSKTKPLNRRSFSINSTGYLSTVRSCSANQTNICRLIWRMDKETHL